MFLAVPVSDADKLAFRPRMFDLIDDGRPHKAMGRSQGVVGSPLMPMTVRTTSLTGARWRPKRITVGVPWPGM